MGHDLGGVVGGTDVPSVSTDVPSVSMSLGHHLGGVVGGIDVPSVSMSAGTRSRRRGPRCRH